MSLLTDKMKGRVDMDNETKVFTLPILPIKRTVLFPGVMMPLTEKKVTI
jgi:hypothetical protein